jgi:hypothetical protein
MVAGGFVAAVTNVCERFNGYAWIESAILATARQLLGGCGTGTISICAGGNTGAVSAVTEAFRYNRDIADLFATEDVWTSKVETILTY